MCATRADKRIERVRYSLSLFVWCFGTKRQYPDVAHHTIALGPRYPEVLTDIFERKRLADDFGLYLHRPTATDPSPASPGCDAFYVLSPVPHLQSGTDWRAQAEPYRRAIQQRLQATLLPGLADEPRHLVLACRSSPRCYVIPAPSPAPRGRRPAPSPAGGRGQG
jgi:phytoene desaturase